MVKIALGAGHGGKNSTAGKRSPDNEYEWNFNDAVVRGTIAKLDEYQDVEILRVDDATGKTDVPLQTRTNRVNAWGADAYVSSHHNANTGKWGAWTGVETYVYEDARAESQALAKAVHPRLVDAMGLRDRGIKKANFHDLRESNCPAILTEGGYMDSTLDIVKMRDSDVLRKAGEAIALGLVAHFGLKAKVTAVKPAPVNPVSKPIVKPTPKPIAKPLAKPPAKKDVHRVIVDGKQIGAYSDDANIIIEIRKALAKGAKKIEVNKV